MKYFFILLAFILGWIAGTYTHPYEQCKRVYVIAEDIGECVWLKEDL